MKKKEDSGIIYIMTTAVSGLIKIGQTQLENFKERMRFLESNGYNALETFGWRSFIKYLELAAVSAVF